MYKNTRNLYEAEQLFTGQSPNVFTSSSCQLFTASSAGVSTGEFTPSISNVGSDFGSLYKSSAAQFHFWRTYVNLTAGTYTFRMVYATSTDRGIATIVLNGNSIGTVDTYAAANLGVGQITGIVVGNSSTLKVELQMNTKNASSSNYYLIWNHAVFIKTA